MKHIQTIFYYYTKELFNDWYKSNKAVFFLKVIIIILSTLLISSYVSPGDNISNGGVISIIILQTIILTWLQTLLSIGSNLFSLNTLTYPAFLGVDKHTNTLALAMFYTYKNSLIGLGISIIFSESYYLLAVYFIIYILSSILSFQLAMIFLVVWVRFIKSFNLLIITTFLSQFILLAGIMLLLYSDYQIGDIRKVLNWISLFIALYILVSVCILLLSIIKKQKFNYLYVQSIDNYNNSVEIDNTTKGRITFIDSIMNPIFYKDLILTLTNPITKLRLYIWGAIQMILAYILLQKGLDFFFSILPFSSEQPEWFILHINLILTFVIFGEVILTFFQMDRGILAWFSFTAYNSSKIIRSKIILGFIILIIPTAIGIIIYSLILTINLSSTFFILLEATFCLVVISVATLSISSLEVKVNLSSKTEVISDSIVSEQIPQSKVTFVSLFVGFIFLFLFYVGINRQLTNHMLGITTITVAITITISMLLYLISTKIYVKNMNIKL